MNLANHPSATHPSPTSGCNAERKLRRFVDRNRWAIKKQSLVFLLLLVVTHGCAMRRSQSVLNANGALMLAQQLAYAKYGHILGPEGLQARTPPVLISDRWVWRCLIGAGLGDADVRVSFNRDGSSPEVVCQFFSSAAYVPPSHAQ